MQTRSPRLFRDRPARLCFLGLLAVVMMGSPRIEAADIALDAGEELTYSVRWALFPGAGQIRIAAAEQVTDGARQLSITTSTETRGFAKALLTFRAHSESIYDVHTGRLVELHESSVARSKSADYTVAFDYANRHALFTPTGAEESTVLPLPEGDPADLITTLMKTRLWNVQVGESKDVLVSYRHEFYELTVHAVKIEKVRTPLGEFETLVLEPRMEKTPPKGMFKRGANVRVWVSRDEARLPVRFQVDFKIGTGVANLVKYSPPTPAADMLLAGVE